MIHSSETDSHLSDKPILKIKADFYRLERTFIVPSYRLLKASKRLGAKVFLGLKNSFSSGNNRYIVKNCLAILAAAVLTALVDGNIMWHSRG